MISGMTVYRKALIIVLLVCVALSFYWIKCQSEIDIFKSFRWEHYLPLQIFQRSTPIIPASRTGVLLDESFEDGSLSRWYKPWSLSGQANASIAHGATSDPKFLSIQLKTKDKWAFQNASIIEVEPGQALSYLCSVKTEGGATVRADIILYNIDRHVVDWHFASESTASWQDWTQLRRSFTIPAGAKYIRFRIAGTGPGKIFMDNVKVER